MAPPCRRNQCRHASADVRGTMSGAVAAEEGRQARPRRVEDDPRAYHTLQLAPSPTMDFPLLRGDATEPRPPARSSPAKQAGMCMSSVSRLVTNICKGEQRRAKESKGEQRRAEESNGEQRRAKESKAEQRKTLICECFVVHHRSTIVMRQITMPKQGGNQTRENRVSIGIAYEIESIISDGREAGIESIGSN